MRKFHVLAIAAGAVLFACLVYAIGLASIWRKILLVGWGFVPLTLVDGVTEIFHAQGWRRCLSGSHRLLPFSRVFSIRLAGSSINHLTPTAGFGGEVTKGFLLAPDREGAEAASSVIVDKLSLALSQIIFVACGAVVVAWKIDLPRGLWFALVTATLLLATGVVGFLLVQKYGKLGSVVRWAVSRHLGGSALSKAAVHMTDVDRALRHFYRDRPLDLPLSVLWHTLAFVWSIIPAFYFLMLLDGRASPAVATAIICLGIWFNLVTFALPVDFGVQESTRVIIFRMLGFSSAAGLTYGIIFRLEQLVWAGVGLALYGVLIARMRGGKEPPVKAADGCLPQPAKGEAAWKHG